MSEVSNEKGAAAQPPGTAGGPEPLMSATPPRKSRHWLKRLDKDLPLPSQTRLRLMIGSIMLSMLLMGWNDGAIGTLIPYLQDYYHVNYLVISTMFITQFAGCLFASFLNIYLADRLGVGVVAPLGAFCQMISFALMCFGGPFGLFLFAWVPNGMGFAWQEAQCNSLVSRLPSAMTYISIVQAFFPLGSVLSPFISTAFIEHVPRTYLYFLIPLGVGLVTVIMLGFAFDLRSDDQIVGKRPKTNTESSSPETQEPQGEKSARSPPSTTEPGSDGQIAPVDVEAASTPVPVPQIDTSHLASSGAKMKRIFKTPGFYPIILFNLFYCGLEVSVSAWATTFLIKERGGTASAGYVSVGYWGGITLSRFICIPLTAKLGDRISVFVYAGAALALELVIWFTHSLPGNAVCFALVGFFLGPIYPCSLMIVTKAIEPELQSGVMGLNTSVASGGPAFMPFIIGLVSDRYGIWTLQPIVVALLGVDLILWTIICRLPRKA